jgi:hypothetical protein
MHDPRNYLPFQPDARIIHWLWQAEARRSCIQHAPENSFFLSNRRKDPPLRWLWQAEARRSCIQHGLCAFPTRRNYHPRPQAGFGEACSRSLQVKKLALHEYAAPELGIFLIRRLFNDIAGHGSRKPFRLLCSASTDPKVSG